MENSVVIGVALTNGQVSRIVYFCKTTRTIFFQYCESGGSIGFDTIDKMFRHLERCPDTKFVESMLYNVYIR